MTNRFKRKVQETDMLDEIIKTALLGTDNYQPELDAGFTDLMQKVKNAEPDKEAAFLKQAGIYFLMQDAAIPVEEIIPDEFTFPENEKYISKEAEGVLMRALKDDNTHLLRYFFQTINKNGQIITPFLVPDVLEKYASDERKMREIEHLCGQTGKNILQLQGKPVSTKSTSEDDIEISDTEGFIRWVNEIRETHPEKIWEIPEDKTCSIFEEILNREKAEKRAELLGLLQTGLSAADETFLLSQSVSKSKTVKAAALQLLLCIDGSAVQKDFLGLLRELLRPEMQKQFLGFKKKLVFILTDSHQLSPEQKKYGLEEISSEKNISDPLHHLYQCITLMPINLIASGLGVEVQDIIDQLYTEWKNSYIQKAFLIQAHNFKNQILVRHIIRTENEISLIDYLPLQDALQEFENLLKTGNSGGNQNVSFAFFNWLFRQEYAGLKPEFTNQIFQILRANCYTIQGKQYYQLGLYLPAESISLLEKEINRTPGANETGYLQQQLQLTLQAINDKQSITT